MFPQASNSDQAKALGFSDYSAYQQAASDFQNGILDPNHLGGYQPSSDVINAAKANAATKGYQAAAGSAVTGLQSQGTSLAAQYQSLLQSTLGQGTVAMNTATSGENAFLGARGLLSQAGTGNSALSQAQLAVQQSNQAAVGSLGFTEAQLQNQIAQNIASIQTGAAGTAAELPLSYGSLALSQAANQANIFSTMTAGSANRYITIPNIGVYDMQSGSVISSTGLGASGRTIVGNY